MGSKKLKVRQKVEVDAKQGQEITEIGEQKIKEAEEVMLPFVGGLEIIDDEGMAAISSRFALPNEDISRAIAAMDEIDDDAAATIDESKRQSEAVCGLGGIPKSEIETPVGEVDSLCSSFCETQELNPALREVDSNRCSETQVVTSFISTSGLTSELTLEEIEKMIKELNEAFD